jgi:acetyl esterase/lipase
MSLGIIILAILLLPAVAFVTMPRTRSLLTPMPITLRRLMRESQEKPPVEGVAHVDLVYRRGLLGTRTLDLYEPLGPFAEGGRAPLVVFLHGGSWIHGDKITLRVVDRLLRRMREAGYFVAAINYTASLLRGFGGPVENTRRSIRWLARHAERFGYDPHNIGLYGVSAGGHLALLVGSAMKEDHELSFAFIFGECAPTDLIGMRDGDAFASSRNFRVFSERRLRELSPISYVRSDLPPILLFHGGKDQTVHLRQSQRYAAALEAVGADVELVTYPQGDHAFLNLTDDQWYEQETRGLSYFEKHFRAKAQARMAEKDTVDAPD